MKRAREVETLVQGLRHAADAEMHSRILGNLLDVLKQRRQHPSAGIQPTVRRIVMRSPITKLAAAAVLVVAIVLSVPFLAPSTPSASAAQIFYQAAQAMSGLKSFHIRVEMRTPPGDNFAIIGLDYEFVPIDFWKQFTDEPWGKWRLEEPGRVVVQDGQQATMLMKGSNTVHESAKLNPEEWWTECLVEVNKVMAREAQKAAEHPAQFTSYREPGEDGREKIVITVEAQSKVPPTDYLQNKYIDDSDHLTVYRFDAETKLLEDLQVYVHDNGKDVAVFRLVQAEYNIDLDPALFQLQLPPDVIRTATLTILSDNEKYEQMTPKEAATAFFAACAKEDWNELLKYLGRTAVPERMKDYLGGLEVLELGEPFQSGGYAGWFVPYKIKLKSGGIKQHNLAVRNDNPAHRFELDGGI
jgi:outer membrane lipoprotein-sorting protein